MVITGHMEAVASCYWWYEIARDSIANLVTLVRWNLKLSQQLIFAI